MSLTKNQNDPSNSMNFTIPENIPSSLLGRLIYRCLPVRRELIESNLRSVFGEQTDPKKITELTQAWYGYLARFFLDTLCNPWKSETRKKQEILVENLEISERALDQGKGLIWLTCHLGSWELAFVNFMAQNPRFQGKVSLIRKRLRPKMLNEWIIDKYQRAGIEVLPKDPSSLKQVLARLKRNEIVMLVLDQHASPSKATLAEFMGRTAQLNKNIARLALQTHAPVVPVVTWRTSGGQHVCHFSEPVPLVEASDRVSSVHLTTQAFCSALEQLVLEHPEQWFCWAHRLWKLDPLRKWKESNLPTPARYKELLSTA